MMGNYQLGDWVAHRCDFASCPYRGAIGTVIAFEPDRLCIASPLIAALGPYEHIWTTYIEAAPASEEEYQQCYYQTLLQLLTE